MSLTLTRPKTKKVRKLTEALISNGAADAPITIPASFLQRLLIDAEMQALRATAEAQRAAKNGNYALELERELVQRRQAAQDDAPTPQEATTATRTMILYRGVRQNLNIDPGMHTEGEFRDSAIALCLRPEASIVSEATAPDLSDEVFTAAELWSLDPNFAEHRARFSDRRERLLLAAALLMNAADAEVFPRSDTGTPVTPVPAPAPEGDTP